MKTLISLGITSLSFAAATLSAQPVISWDFNDGTEMGWAAGQDGVGEGGVVTDVYADTASALEGSYGLYANVDDTDGWTGGIISLSSDDDAELLTVLQMVYAGDPSAYQLSFEVRSGMTGFTPAGDWYQFHYIINDSSGGWAQAEVGDASTLVVPETTVTVTIPLSSTPNVPSDSTMYRLIIGGNSNGGGANAYYFDFDNIRIEPAGGAEPEMWGEWEVGADGWVDTGDFVGWIYPIDGGFVWSGALETWMYLPADSVSANGSWTYIYR